MADDTKELLLSMMQRYDIGKKPLSRLLGWGDTTVMRYLDGVEPNREFAARIQELAENPHIFADILEKNKEKLTDTAYRKASRAVYREIFCDRSTEAAQYVIELAEGDIAPYRVMMVLYYSQICSMVLWGLPILEEAADFSADQQLVYPKLYQKMMQYGLKRMTPEASSLSSQEQDCLKQVYLVLNGYSPNALKGLYARAKHRIRRHLKQEADQLLPETLKNEYENDFYNSGVECPGDLKKYISYALKRSEKTEI